MTADPRLFDWLRQLTESGEPSPETIVHVRDSLTHGDVEPRSVCALARAVLAEGHASTAARLIETVLSMDPQSASAHVLHGQMLAAGGQTEQAIAAVQHALSLETERDELYEDLTASQMDPRCREAAWAALTGALDRRPYQSDHYRRAAQAYERVGLPERGIELLELALRRNGDDLESREVLAHAYCDLGRYEDAVAQCAEALRRNPRRFPALELMHNAYVQMGRLAEATEIARKQLALMPMDATLHFRLGALHHEQGNLGQALARFSRVLSLASDSELAQAATHAIGSIDNFQLQRIVVLAIEDRLFGLKLRRNAQAALYEYGFHVSPPALMMVQMLDFEGLLESAQFPRDVTHH